MKSAIERSVVASGFATFIARKRRDFRLVLAYHNVVPDHVSANGDKSLHLSRESFARQLDVISEVGEVCSLENLLKGVRHTQRPLIAVTFDDAYHGAMSTGVSELRKRDMPATVFVAPGCLGGRAFWWDVAASDIGLDPKLRLHALTVCKGEDRVIREWMLACQLPQGRIHRASVSATQDELRTAMSFPLMTVASHSWSHPNLVQCGDTDVRAELDRSMIWLREQYGERFRPLLAYPYGMSDGRVEGIAKAAGYLAGLRVEGGWIRRHSINDFSLPRLNVPAGLSVDGFRLRMAGIFAS